MTKKTSRKTVALAQANPARSKALFAEAATLFCQEQFAQAERILDQHLALSPASLPGLSLKAMIASQTGRAALAEAIWQQIMVTYPQHVDAYVQLAALCEQARRYGEAEGHLRKALALAPNHAAALLGLGRVYRQTGAQAQALLVLQQVWQLDPTAVEAQLHIAAIYLAQGEIVRAIAAYQQVFRTVPDHTEACSKLLFCQHYLPQQSPEQKLAWARRYGELVARGVMPERSWPQEINPERRLRIGLVSADLRQHPVGYFIEAVLPALDRNVLELVVFSNSETEDDLSARLRQHVAAWHQLAASSDAAFAQAILAAQIDILIDLSGHSQGHRLGVFAQRAAPVQVSWLGYFASTGVPTMDYVLADPHCVPPEEATQFTENIWYLPHSRFCFAPPVDAPPVSAAPLHQPFTFGCWQDLPKINDAVLQVWARILAACPAARLRIQSVRLGYAEVRQAFYQRAQAAGISPQQLTLLGPMRREDYLQTYGEVDMVLDTFPYPGGTTTLEAAWMGVPTLTLATPGMLGRQGAGLLSNLGLSDWICHSADDYVAKALSWVAQRDALAAMRQPLRDTMQASPVCDAPAFALAFTEALRGMWRRWCAR